MNDATYLETKEKEISAIIININYYLYLYYKITEVGGSKLLTGINHFKSEPFQAFQDKHVFFSNEV